MATPVYPLENAFRRMVSPFERFLANTAAGGLVLIGATALAILAATLIGQEAFDDIWHQAVELRASPEKRLGLSLHDWINEGVMTLFFLLVGLEIKREVQVGELSSLRDAMLPAVAAVGGVIVPALIYLAFNPRGPAAAGWAIPAATDIAFAVGILMLLGSRVPRGAVVFMTALAIVDDLAAIVAIALFYAKGLDASFLFASGVITLALMLMNRAAVRSTLAYAIVGTLLWYAMLRSGLHATLAGLVTALAIPARSRFTVSQFRDRIDILRAGLAGATASGVASVAVALETCAVDMQSPLQRIEHRLAPWVAFVVVPVFAIANAGIDLRAIEWDGVFAHPVTLGVAAGLCIGKVAGISGFAMLAVVTGMARLPTGVSWSQLFGCAWFGGIGFTMSLFIGQLAFADAAGIEAARLGTLLGSAAAAVAGTAALLLLSPKVR